MKGASSDRSHGLWEIAVERTGRKEFFPSGTPAGQGVQLPVFRMFLELTRKQSSGRA